MSRSTDIELILSVVNFVTQCCFSHGFWPDGHYAAPFYCSFAGLCRAFLVCVDTTWLTRTFIALACGRYFGLSTSLQAASDAGCEFYSCARSVLASKHCKAQPIAAARLCTRIVRCMAKIWVVQVQPRHGQVSGCILMESYIQMRHLGLLHSHTIYV